MKCNLATRNPVIDTYQLIPIPNKFNPNKFIAMSIIIHYKFIGFSDIMKNYNNK